MSKLFSCGCLRYLLFEKAVRGISVILILSLLIFSSSGALANEKLTYNIDGSNKIQLAQNKQSMKTSNNSEIFKLANSYFENQVFMDFCIKSAIEECMKAGYHGTFTKAMYFDAESSTQQDINMRAKLSVVAWFNLVNTKRVIDAAIEVTQHPERIKSLRNDAGNMQYAIKLMGKSKFGWREDEIKKMQDFTVEIINKKIDEIKSK
jgi:hypothetical protein